MSARYAIYFAPEEGSALARLGDQWLGRAAESGLALERPHLPGLDPARLQALTEAPRHYGFHGTLKPPFQLAAGVDGHELATALAGFARGRQGFELPGLRLDVLGDFLALVPAAQVPELGQLAESCVVEFDGYRAPPSGEEIARRQAAALTPRQAELLARWGYPYVLDEFRFHLTLTGPITDAGERTRLQDLLATPLAPIMSQAVPVRELCLFQQPDRAAPFRLAARFPFGQ